MKNRWQDNNRKRLSAERGTVFHGWQDRRLRVALVYPNCYSHGMSNLGFQTVYHLINSRSDCLCERFFLPDREDLGAADSRDLKLLSMESERPLRDFDLIALSVSFENDYLNLPLLFELAGLPLAARDRSCDDPPVLFGGVCAFLNPEPLADIADLVAIGEAEGILPQLLDRLVTSGTARETWSALTRIRGIYVPGFYRPEYDGNGQFSGFSRTDQVPGQVERVFADALDRTTSRNFIQTPDTEFGRMALTEVSRGCSRGCRFCAAGYIYLPPRERSLDTLWRQIDEGLGTLERVGLVAAAVADHSDIEALQQRILAAGKKISISSLRLDALTVAEVENLKKADHKTVAIAPEAGSQRMRDFINKGLDEEQILHAVQLLADGGILNLKLYFIVGLPTEEQADIEELVGLASRIGDIWRAAGRARGRMGTVTLSVNPFVPKPFTPLQWAGMDSEKSLKKKYRFLQSAVSRIPNMRLHSESIREARLQAFLSRGDRRVGALLEDLAAGRNLKHVCREHGMDPEAFITASFGEESLFPWDIIDQGFGKDYLWKEYRRAYSGQLTAPCVPGCQRCGVCGV